MTNRVKQQAGLSLVELLVAITLGLIISVGLTQLFTSNSKTFSVTEGLSRIQETGRTATGFLGNAVRNADYWGCVSRASLRNHLDSTSSNYNAAIDAFDRGFDTVQSDGSDGAVAGTDTLTLRGAGNDGGIRVTASMPDSSADLNLSSVSGITKGQILMVSDCIAGDIFQVSGVSTSSKKIQHNTGNVVSPGNIKGTGGVAVVSDNNCPGNASNCLSKQYDNRAEVLVPHTDVFEIRKVGSNRGLFMSEDGGTPVELVRGVWDMQIRAGIDNGLNSGKVDSWVDVGKTGLTQTQADDTIAVQISLLVRSRDDGLVKSPMKVCFPAWSDCSGGLNYAATAGDNHLYRVYMVTSTIRNRMLQAMQASP